MMQIISHKFSRSLRLFTSFLIMTIPVSIAQASQVNVSVKIVKPPCKINNNQVIYVNFGNSVITTKIDGRYNRIPIQYTIDCKSATSPNLKMTISGNGADFDKKVLETDNYNLGVALYNGTSQFILNSTVSFNLANSLKLEAVLVKRKDSVLRGGKFNASATMAIEYQ